MTPTTNNHSTVKKAPTFDSFVSEREKKKVNPKYLTKDASAMRREIESAYGDWEADFDGKKRHETKPSKATLAYKVDESAPMLMTEPNPYLGYYDAANGDMNQLLKSLRSAGIDHEHDGFPNYCMIRSSDYETVRRLLDEADIYKAPFDLVRGYYDSVAKGESPSDCVMWRDAS